MSRDENLLEKHKHNEDDYGNERFEVYGELYGYPKTAIENFIEDMEDGERYKVNYYGLEFVCKRTDLDQVKKELEEMYGLTTDSQHVTLENC